MKIVADKNKSKAQDFSNDLVGNVKQELSISPRVFKKWTPYFKNLMAAYVDAHPKGSSKAVNSKKINFPSAWYVRSYAGDFNPLHFHTNCHLSSVGYLSLPKGMKKEWEQEDNKHYPTAGEIEWKYGETHLFSTNTLIMRPKVGDFYIFPWWLYHMVYPFRCKGERRSFSINVIANHEEANL